MFNLLYLTLMTRI